MNFAKKAALTVTAANAPAFDVTVKAAFDAVRAQQPRPSDAWSIKITESAADFIIALTPKDGANPDPGAIHLFERNKVIRLDPPKVEKGANGALTLTVLKEEGSTGSAEGFLHAAKGWLAVWLAARFGPAYGLNETGLAMVALAVFLGHLFPVYHRFAGGKGVATAAGILLAIDPILGLGTLATWLIIAFFFRYSSLAALVSAIFAPFFYVLMNGVDVMTGAIFVISVLLIARHRQNIAKLLAGKESRIGDKKKV